MKYPLNRLCGILLGMLLPAIAASVFAQNNRGTEQDPNVISFPTRKVEKMATLDFSRPGEDWAPVFKTIVPVHTPGTDLEKDRFLAIKEQANLLREEAERQETNSSQKNNDIQSLGPPETGSQFQGNINDGSTPSDNGIAVSAAGKIVSVTNSRIHIFDATGQALSAESFSAFSAGAGVGNNIKFDPKVTYDPVADRFIFVFLNGSSPSNSKVVVCFSATNDPTGSWHFYSFSGNVTGNVWTDFPQIGISTEELFVTGNLFTNSSAQGGAVWQIGLAEGYAGQALNVTVHNTNYFSMHPVEGGITMYGPHFYFLSSQSSGGSAINLHKMTNTADAGGVFLSPVSINLQASYSVPPDAVMKGTSRVLSTNDCRVQSSYFENNRAQFTLNSGYLGKPAVYYGTVIISPFLLSFSSGEGKYIRHSKNQYAYGAVAYAGRMGTDGTNASFVSFNYTSGTEFPGNAAVYVSILGEIGPHKFLKKGSSAIAGQSPARWGDYSDIAERHNNPGEAWVGASYGPATGNQSTFISQIFTPLPVGTAELKEEKLPEMQIFPNPVADRVSFEFDVEKMGNYQVQILNTRGELIKDLVDDKLKAGTARLAFNTNHLPSGLYLVVVRDEENQLFSEKFIVKH